MKIIIIGAGPGGYETALAARERGCEVILIESGQVGGTCLNAGCIPTKAYCRSAGILEETRNASEFGIEIQPPVLDFSRIKSRKDAIVAKLRSNVKAQLSAAGVVLVRGKAVFVDSTTVRVEEEDYSADYIIIATGSVPSMPDIPGIELPRVIDSTALLEIEELPESLCIIGGGVIGLEFASVFCSFGCKVTVVEYCKEILPRYDKDIAKRLRQALAKRGVTFFLQSEVKSLDEVHHGIRVNWSRKGEEGGCEADYVLVAVGRRPNAAGLGLEAAGVSLRRSAVAVDEDMRTNVRSIFAIGDVNGLQLLAHAAVFQGKKALNAITGKDDGIDLSVMPSAVFTMPEAASVGLTEEICQEQGLDYKVDKSFYRANGKAVCLGETDGLCKIISSREGKILGCHIMGPHAADLVQEVSVLMSSGIGLSGLKSAVHIHPTLSEVLL